jgi:hypothetical protein
MQNTITKKDLNRRSSKRHKLLEPVKYTNDVGALQRGQLLNLGSGGARLVTNLDIEVGQHFLVLHKATGNVTLRSQVEVKWVKPLPGGLRQVVGVRELRTSVIPTDCRATVALT